MSLNETLTKAREERAAKRPAHAQKIMDEEALRWEQANLIETSLQVGDKAPEFTLSNATGKPVSSGALLKNGPLVVSFYRGAWCPYCNLELRALQGALPEIEAVGAQLVAISPNRPDSSLLSVEKHNLTFQVLSDVGNTVARRWGLVFNIGESLQAIFQKIGHDVTGQNGDDTWEIPVPATYIIDSAGTIIYRFVNVDYTQRAEPADVMKVLNELQPAITNQKNFR